jgi:hypothetical protein
MGSSTASVWHRASLLSLLALLASPASFAQTTSSEAPDSSMLLQNATSPFVTADFAKRLGAVVMQQKYVGFSFTDDSPTVVDKGDTWWVTFTIKEWPKNLEKLHPASSDHLTVWIRKRDAAIVAIR